MIFENAKSLVRGLGYSVDQAVLTQSYLRSEVALSTSIANYHLPVLVNDTQNGSVRINERRLNLQDIFVTSEIAVLIGVGSSTSTTAALYTYPNGQIFTASTDTDLLSINNLPQNFGNEGDFIEFFVYDNNNNLLIVIFML